MLRPTIKRLEEEAESLSEFCVNSNNQINDPNLSDREAENVLRVALLTMQFKVYELLTWEAIARLETPKEPAVDLYWECWKEAVACTDPFGSSGDYRVEYEAWRKENL